MKHLLSILLAVLLIGISFHSNSQHLIPFRKGNLYGLSNIEGEILVKPQWDEISYRHYNRLYTKGCFVVSKNEKMGIYYLDSLVVPIKYDKIESLHDNLFQAYNYGDTNKRDKKIDLFTCKGQKVNRRKIDRVEKLWSNNNRFYQVSYLNKYKKLKHHLIDLRYNQQNEYRWTSLLTNCDEIDWSYRRYKPKISATKNKVRVTYELSSNSKGTELTEVSRIDLRPRNSNKNEIFIIEDDEFDEEIALDYPVKPYPKGRYDKGGRGSAGEGSYGIGKSNGRHSNQATRGFDISSIEQEQIGLFWSHTKTKFITPTYQSYVKYRYKNKLYFKDHYYLIKKDQYIGKTKYGLASETLNLEAEYDTILGYYLGGYRKPIFLLKKTDENGILTSSIIQADSLPYIKPMRGVDLLGIFHPFNLFLFKSGNYIGLMNGTGDTLVQPNYISFIPQDKFHLLGITKELNYHYFEYFYNRGGTKPVKHYSFKDYPKKIIHYPGGFKLFMMYDRKGKFLGYAKPHINKPTTYFYTD